MGRRREREILKDCHKNIKWFNKVEAMTDKEVIDILRRLRSQGKAAA